MYCQKKVTEPILNNTLTYVKSLYSLDKIRRNPIAILLILYKSNMSVNRCFCEL